VRQLLAEGAQVDSTDAFGRTALHITMLSDCAASAQARMLQGAVAGWKGPTDLHMVAELLDSRCCMACHLLLMTCQAAAAQRARAGPAQRQHSPCDAHSHAV
jgi:hypothetical protein